VSVVFVVGLNHASAPFDLLERVHVGNELHEKLLAELTAEPGIDETVVLTTCQRTEIYIAAEWYHSGPSPASAPRSSTSTGLRTTATRRCCTCSASLRDSIPL
jgi:glutamyl-tRNA reductase